MFLSVRKIAEHFFWITSIICEMQKILPVWIYLALGMFFLNYVISQYNKLLFDGFV